VESMTDNDFIIGRDILQSINGIIDNHAIELRIGEVRVPLMRPHNTVYIERPQPIVNQKSLILPPYSEGKIASYLRKPSRQSKNVFPRESWKRHLKLICR
jgi:hypothetical protein